ncbi:DUF397 domain-containing protein [Actinosynnema sp. ALI-1.44]|uniref:DUF397 domain-containing protein n=1 Tax=Actinosynnema sp. ALI-1.44 TaxID=1933779 RepID=UPI000A009ECA|nr:DUF397 domain-containing protein [Actinosynnema sp. ALI-1.44]
MTEAQTNWRKSSFSAEETDCVEVAGTLTAVRDSKNPSIELDVPLAPLLAAIRGGGIHG